MKQLNYKSVEVSGVDSRDYPDFVDAYIVYAEWEDGTSLSYDELDDLNENSPEIAQELAMESLI